MAIAWHLVQQLSPETDWQQRVADHLHAFPTQASQRKLNVSAMGAPADWEGWWLGNAAKKEPPR
jgi:hypothetical protein